MKLRCYTAPDWAPRIRPGEPTRDWMDTTPESYAYRCLPLTIANMHGWEILSPCSFAARWHGGEAAASVEIDLSRSGRANFVPQALFGGGVLTFHIEGLFRSPPGWNLWVSGPPNRFKDGIAPLSALVETDWAPYTFTMNWKFTRPNVWIEFEEGEPICFFFPVQRGAIEQFDPELRPMADDPELEQDFSDWAKSRLEFHRKMREDAPENPSDRWQKLYYRGLKPNGAEGTKDHATKLRLREFAVPALPTRNR